MNKTQAKWGGVALLMLAAFFLIYPSVNWYGLDAAERTKLEALRERPKWLVNLGLDLKGGTHMTMELEVDKLPKDIPLTEAMAQAIEIIRNRIDQYGVAEPIIARQGARWIVVQLPGISDSAQAKELVGKTALLEFRMVDESEKARAALNKILELGNPFEGALPTAAAAKLVPEGLELFKGKDSAMFLLTKEVPLNGAALETAKVETGGEYGLPVVAFKFKPEAAAKFASLTSANVGRNMAIVLDRVVYSAPVIKGRISGGSGIIEGQFTPEDAKGLAIVLRAGALPAPVRIIEERTVGPSLGEDSIRRGFQAAAVGVGLIMAFFAVYYRSGGMIANVAIVANLFLLFALMAYLKATLTLPGIAGLALNVAMAVDANVLILERIKEELAKGRPLKTAVAAGYDLSASAIIDSNLTLLIASALLFQFGTGPIKGCAVTLTGGNIISMFTATVLTRMLYEAWILRSDDADAAAA
ncbi:MAG: protein translocase subunit SecD [Elusimicrobiota bacterium]|nr:protein translocase subunit SecD [Elusimicrobiota bacterium]